MLAGENLSIILIIRQYMANPPHLLKHSNKTHSTLVYCCKISHSACFTEVLEPGIIR